MLIEFRTTSDTSVTLFESVAQRLLGLTGVDENIPGALEPDEVAAARRNLESVMGFQQALANGRTITADGAGRLQRPASELIGLFKHAEENNDGVKWSRF